MGELYVEKSSEPVDPNYRWYRELNRYHWFVFIVCALGWIFDCLDQQLFTLARTPAMQELLSPEVGKPAPADQVALWGTLSTSIFLVGWASGGIIFGILGDKIGRAKTMLWTILIYSVFTGLSAFSHSVWDFCAYRFLTGLGVGGEFAVGVALLAEVMPNRARPHALGMLQGLSTVGNIMAALIGLTLAGMAEQLKQVEIFGIVLSGWRVKFMIGTLPALLAILIRMRLKEPERWQSAVAAGGKQHTAGSLRELFGDPRWRKRAIVGMLLASAGVIGLWGIGFFGIDLNRSVFRKTFNEEQRQLGEAEKDRTLLKSLLADVDQFKVAQKEELAINLLLNTASGPNDAQALYTEAGKIFRAGKPLSETTVLAGLDLETDKLLAQSPEVRERREKYLAEAVSPTQPLDVAAEVKRIKTREKGTTAQVDTWVAYSSMMFQVGAFFGIYVFTKMAQRYGRRPTFAIAFIAAMLSTAWVFMYISKPTDVFWMTPVMGFCQLSIFGGYAIYFPELFPTRLRSTGTSFCYNVGRFVAATGPLALGLLTSKVFHASVEPMRWAGVTMCSIFIVGLLVLPFAPETKDQPLPE